MSQTTVESFFTSRKRRTAITEFKNEHGKSSVISSLSKKASSKTQQNVEYESKVQTTESKVNKIKLVKKTKPIEKTAKVEKNKLVSQKREAQNDLTEIPTSSDHAKKTDVKPKTVKVASTKQTQSSSKTTQKSKPAKVPVKKKAPSKVKNNQKVTDFYTPSKPESDCSIQIPANKESEKVDSQCLKDNELKSEDVVKTDQVDALTPRKTTLSGAVQSPKRKLPPPKDVTPSKKQAMLEDDGKVSYVPITPSKDGVSSARKKLDMDSLTKKMPVDSLQVVTPSKSPKLGKLDNMIEQSRSKLILSPKMDQFRKSLSSFNEKATKVQERLSNPFKVTCIAKAGLSPSKKQAVLTSKTASELFPSFKDPTFHKELILPRKFKLLSELFRSLETVITMLNNRKEQAVFDKVKEGVQKIVKRTFTKTHLGQIMAVYPDAYNVTVEKCSYITKTADSKDYQYVLTPVLLKGKSKKQQPMTPQSVLERLHSFNENLLEIVKNHHLKFLNSINFKLAPDKEIKRWHPEFVVDSVPDIQPVDLPEPEECKTYTAKDVLNKIKSSFRTKSKKIENALQSVVGPSIEETKVQKDIENLKTKSKSEALGICPSLLAKIRAKETAKNLEKMTQTPLEREMLAMKERLPKIVKIIWHYFVAEKKKVILLTEIIEKIKDSLGSHITHDAVKRHLNLVEKEYNGWLQFIELEKGTYVRIDKARDINRMVDL